MSKTGSKNKSYRTPLIITVILIVIAVGASVYLNSAWRKIKLEYGISYDYLSIGFRGTITTKNLYFNAEEVGNGQIDTLFLNINIWPLIQGKVSVDELYLSKSKLDIIATESEESTDLPNLEVAKLYISDLEVLYHNTDTILNMKSGTLGVEGFSMDTTYNVSSLSWRDAEIFLKSVESTAEPKEDSSTAISLSSLPDFEVGFLDLENLKFTHKSDSSKLVINDFYFENVYVANHTELELQFDTLSLNLNDTLPLGLAITETQWAEPDPIKSENIRIGIPGLHLKLADFTLEPSNNFPFSLSLNHSQITFEGLTLLYAYMGELMNQDLPRDSSLTLWGSIKGDMNHVQFTSLNLDMLSGTSTELQGTVDWSTDTGSIDLSLQNLRTRGKDIRDFLEPMDYNTFFTWPTEASGTATISGNFDHYLIIGNLNTPHGPLEVNTVVDFPNEEDIFYDIIVSSEDLKVNEIIEYLAVDVTRGNIRAEMAGLYSDISERDTFLLSLDLFSFTAEGYDLSNLKFFYYFNNAYDSLWGNLDDTALTADIKGAYYGGDTSTVPFAGNIHKAIPGLLDTLVPKWNYQGQYSGAYKYDDADFFEIVLQLDSNRIKWHKGAQENLEALNLDFIAHGDDYDISVTAGHKNKLHLGFPYPDYELADLGWFQVMDSMEFFSLEATVTLDSTFANNFLGIPFSISIQELNIDHNRQQHSWSISAGIPQLGYDDVIVENLSALIKISPDTINGAVGADLVNYSDIPIQNPILTLEQKDSNLIWRVSSSDINKLGPTNIHTLQSMQNGVYLFNFVETDTLILIGHPWTVSNNQGLLFTEDFKLNGGNLELKQEKARIGLETKDQDLMTFHIDSISLVSLIAPFAPEIKLEGYLNSDILYQISTTQASLRAEATHVVIDSVDLGDWVIEGSYDSKTAMASVENKTLKGGLRSDIKYENSQLDYKFHLQNFDLSFLNNALPDQELGISGLLNGEITGVYTDELDTKGWLQINQGTFDIPYLKTSVSLDKDSILFKNRKLFFNQFHINDPDGNPLYVNGQLDLIPDLEYDLTIKGHNYTFLDQDKGDLISGRASASMDLKLIGTPDKTSASGTLNILPDSYITYTLSDEVTAVKRGGDILFVSFAHTDTVARLKGTTEQDIDLDIDFVMDKTNFEIILNPVTQEYLKLDASGSLNLSKDGYAAPLLFGQLSSNSGRSRIDLPIVPAANLDIENASIRWDGPYDDPSISFKGTEEFKSSMDGVMSMEHRKDLIPVTLEIKLNEARLNKIDFVFDLTSSDQELDSYLKSRTAEEREQFATNLLLFGTLSTEGSDGSDKMLNMYTAKLNEIANRNLKNTDLVLGVDNETEYNSQGQEVIRTKLSYSLRRGFYNDRAFISVGGDLGLYSEGHPDPERAASHFIGNISLDYQLFDGKPLWVKAAREERYAGVIDGDIVEYRLGLGFYKTYPTFWAIFGQDHTNDKAIRNEEDD